MSTPKKTTAKKTTKKAAAKKTTKKAAAKKTTKKATKKATKKTAAKKTAKKAAAKKTTKKAAAKKTTKKAAAKKTTKKAAAKKAAAKKTPARRIPKPNRVTPELAPETPPGEAPAPAPVKPPEPPEPPQPPVGDQYSVLKPDYHRLPAATAINRIGGLPIGIDAATWPRHKGASMYHVLTIDLKDHPSIVAQRFRALALFISHPMHNEAWESGTSHTEVVLLTEAELEKGVPAWPDDLDQKAALRAGTVRFESAADLTQKQLYQHSFAGPDPIWLQGDEDEDDFGFGFGDDDDGDGDDGDGDGDSDGDGDEDSDGDGDSEAPPAPRHQNIPHMFVLQFDERLIPGINLGDAGIMYVFSDDAWWQCH